MQGSGNQWEASLLNTERWWWYLAGILPSPIWDPTCSASLEASVCFFSEETGMDIHAMCIVSGAIGFHQFGPLQPASVIVHCAMHDSMAFLVCRMSGSWLLSIHPCAQSIFG